MPEIFRDDTYWNDFRDVGYTEAEIDELKKQDEEKNKEFKKRSEEIKRKKELKIDSCESTGWDSDSEDYKPYRPDTEHTIYSYIKFLSKLETIKCKTYKKCLSELKKIIMPRLSCIIRKVTQKSMIFVGKISEKEPYSMGINISPKGYLSNSLDGSITLEYNEPAEGDKVKKDPDAKYTKTIGPFYLLLIKPLLISQKIVLEPYHMDTPPKNSTHKLNIFPGFKATYHPDWSIEKCYKILTPLTDHLNYIFSGDDSICNRVLEHLFYPIRELNRNNVMLVIIGTQGIGKTIIFDFIQKYVFGRGLAVQLTGLDPIVDKFNKILENKMFIIINETAQIGSAKGINNKQAEILKTRIDANDVSIEPKGEDSYTVDNISSYVLTTNNDNPLVIDPTDRKYFIIKCDVEKKVKKYYTDLADGFNQRMGDAFYTLARKSGPLCDIKDIPMNEVKKDMIKNSRARGVEFFTEVLENSYAIITKDCLHVLDNKIYISTEDFYHFYLKWHKLTNNGKEWNQNMFSREAKKNKSLDHKERKRINKIPQKAYFIFGEELYDKVYYLDDITEQDYPIGILVSPKNKLTIKIKEVIDSDSDSDEELRILKEKQRTLKEITRLRRIEREKEKALVKVETN